ncbi:hypothetical protein [Streptomyces sp. M1013]|uniref:hypothetical protein n=1 Tax=Streptomyces sp. M1013 TaxID=549798 RepID=UPI00209B9547|nr:hypothetical protein [Streptomyces sp. M1013]
MREILTYLSAALPQFTSPAARMLALQCALRSNNRGHVTLPDGLLRGMRLQRRWELWLELAQAGWLQAPSIQPGTMSAQLLDATVLDQAPGRSVRRRAAQWALRPAPLVLPAAAPAALRLTALVLASHFVSSPNGAGDLAAVSRLCGHCPQQTKELLDRLVSARTLESWHYHQGTDEVLWRFPQQPPASTATRDS